MEYPHRWSGQYPPDNSGTWYAVDWGLWTQDPAYNPASGKKANRVVPQGWYFEPQLNSIFKNVPDPTLDSKTVDNVKDAIDKAKRLEDTKVGQVLSSIYNYGTQFLNLLYGFKILDPAKPITYDNVNKQELENQLRAGTLSQIAYIPKVEPPTNSTYFGIDFSKPINWVIVGLAVFAIYKIVSSASQPNVSQNANVRQLSRDNRKPQRLAA